MPTSFYLLLIAFFMPFVPLFWVKGEKSYDNANPREFYKTLSGVQQRAMACHQNHLEALVYFAVAFFVAQFLQVPANVINALSASFVLFRIAYTWAYIANKATVRSLIWTGGFFSCICLFLVKAFI